MGVQGVRVDLGTAVSGVVGGLGLLAGGLDVSSEVMERADIAAAYDDRPVLVMFKQTHNSLEDN